MGDGYGPMLVTLSAPPKDLQEISNWLADKRVAVPGLKTSAYLAFRLFTANGSAVVVPFDEIFDFVKAGKADVGLLIHEGQLTYANQGFHLALDLGAWWKDQTGLPLPLGGNVIRKDIPTNQRKEISAILQESIRYGLEHRNAGIEHSMPLARDLDLAQADKFISMYVNDFTLDYGKVGRQAIREFLGQANKQGLISNPIEIEFVE